MTREEAARLLPQIMEALGEDFIKGFYLTPEASRIVFEAAGMTKDEAKNAVKPDAFYVRFTDPNIIHPGKDPDSVFPEEQ